MPTEQDLVAQIRRVNNMPYGQARSTAAEMLLEEVKSSDFSHWLPTAHIEVVESYTFDDEPVKAMAAFAQLIRLYDERPDLFDDTDTHNFYWAYKWIASAALDVPHISAAQIDSLLADMDQRYRIAGLGLGAVRQAEFSWVWHRGAANTEELMKAWLAEESSTNDDCQACVIGLQTSYYLWQQDYERTLAVARGQRWSCNQEPWNTRMAEAMAAFRLGDDDHAVRAYKAALATEENGPHSNRGSTLQTELLCASGHVEQAVGAIYQWLSKGTNAPLSDLRMSLAAVRGLTEAADSRYDELRDTCVGIAADLAGQFDARNGTTTYTDELSRALALPASMRKLDFDAQARELAQRAKKSVKGRVAAEFPDEASGYPVQSGSHTSQVTDNPVSVDAAASPNDQPPREDIAGRAGEAPYHGVVHEDPLAEAQDEWEVAERCVVAKNYMDASYYFQRSAYLLREGGYVDRAGLAFAEAAQCLNVAGENLADELFEQAVTWLRAGGAQPIVVAQVCAAWAPVASGNQRSNIVLSILDDLLAESSHTIESLADQEDAVGERDPWEAIARDTRARLLLDLNTRLDVADIDASCAATLFSSARRRADAAYAWWLHGRIARDLGHTQDAEEALLLAFNAFTNARMLTQRSYCGEELLELLRDTGQSDKAQALTQAL